MPPTMLTPDDVMLDRRLGRLSKRDREFALAFFENLEKGSRKHGDVPLLKDWRRLEKANPTPGDIHVSTELTDFTVAYIQDMSASAAAGQGVVPVQNVAGQFNLYDRGDWNRIDELASRRGPGAESAGGGFKVTQGSYSCITRAWHKDVDEQLMGNQIAGDPVDDATAYVVQQLVLIRELVFVNNLLTTGIWTGSAAMNGGGAGGDITGVAAGPGAGQTKQWDQAGATPREDLGLQAISIHQQSGRWPNVLCLSPFVLKGLILSAEIQQAFQYTTAGAVPDLDALAKALIVPAIAGYTPPKIVVAGMTQTTSAEGAADTLAYLAGKVALLAYIDPRPSLRTPTAWAVFAWAGMLGANAYGLRMKDFELPRNAVPHRVEGEYSFDIRQVAAFLGVFFNTIVS
jgi:hypothetical protein